MPLSDHEIWTAAEPTMADLVGTLGWSLEEARSFIAGDVATLGTFVEDSAQFMLYVAEQVQQRLHDEFIDTTWPTCPIHHRHPLWLDDNDRVGPWFWRCLEQQMDIAPLGGLGSATAQG